MPKSAQAAPDEIPKIEIDTDLPQATWHPKKKLKLEHRTQVEIDGNTQDDGSRNYSIKNAVGATYSYTPQVKFSAFLPYRATHKVRKGLLLDGQYHSGDFVLGVAFKPSFDRGFFNEVVFIQNLHLPTGEESRALTKNRGALSNAIVANHKISNTVDFRLSEEGSLYNQTMGWYEDGKRKVANYQSSLSEYGEFDWSPIENLTFTQYFGYVHTWYMSAPVGPLVAHEAYLESAVSYTVRHRATLLASYRNSADTHNAEHDWSPYRPDESTIVSALKLMF